MDNKDFENKARDAYTNIQSSAKTILNEFSRLSEQIQKFKKLEEINITDGLNALLNFSNEIAEDAQKFAALEQSGVLTYHYQILSSLIRDLKDIKTKSEYKTLVDILQKRIRDFYSIFYNNIEYLSKELKKQVISAKIDQVIEESRKNITNPFLELARHGLKFKKAAEIVQTGIVGMEAGKPIGTKQTIISGTMLALGQFGEKILSMTKIFEIVSGTLSKVTLVSGGITLLLQAIIGFLNYQRKLQAALGSIGVFNLPSLSNIATRFQKGFQDAIGGAFGGIGAGISKIQDAVAQFLGSSPRLFNISTGLVENISAAFTKAAVLSKAFGMSMEESMGNLMKFYSVIGLAGNKLYEIYKFFVGLAAKSRLSFSELDEIIGNIPRKIMYYGIDSVKKFGLSLSNVINSFKDNIELGKMIASGISSYLNKSLVYQVGMIAAYGDLTKAQEDFTGESYSALWRFFSTIKKNLGESVFGNLAIASALGQFFDEGVEKAYFTNKDTKKAIDELIAKGFTSKEDFNKIYNEIKNKTYEEKSLEILTKEQDLLQYIVQIIEDIKRAVNRLVSIFLGDASSYRNRILKLIVGNNKNAGSNKGGV
jgi:polyhydroxyalkanoate synthesis regulator phasin